MVILPAKSGKDNKLDIIKKRTVFIIAPRHISKV
jgi:hypothetical protein